MNMHIMVDDDVEQMGGTGLRVFKQNVKIKI